MPSGVNGSASHVASAKINLTLHVTGQRDDGYHLLDSLVCFASVGDVVSVSMADEPSFAVTGPMAAGVPMDQSNLVLQAAALMGAGPLSIKLEKHLPAAAGIGGGSADAAATLRAIADASGLNVPDDLQSLGADVPVCMFDQAVRMQGVGERITPVPSLPDVHAVLVNPRIDVPTPAVFNALQSKSNPAMDGVGRFATVRELVEWLKLQRNDLQAPAIEAFPVVADALSALDTSAFAAMSGSGATCYGIFETAGNAADAANAIAQKYPDWWVQACQFR